jgi:hypothetical protein
MRTCVCVCACALWFFHVDSLYVPKQCKIKEALEHC